MKPPPLNSCCPLTKSPRRRSEADRTTAGLRPAFPPGVAAPALRALAAAGFTRLDQLARVREADLLALHGMGPKAVATLRAALRAQGRDFRR